MLHEEHGRAWFGQEQHCKLTNGTKGVADLTIMWQLILVWTPGKESPVHDHADSHCAMKVLQGSLKETQYKWPERKVTEECQYSPLQVQGSTLLNRDDVTYISDKVSRVGSEHFGEAS